MMWCASISLALQAEYAAEYARGEHGSSPIPPNQHGEHVVLLCWVAVGNVYPITRNTDYSVGNNKCHLFGGPLKPGFSAHCAAISRAQQYQAASNPSQAEYDEIVVKDAAQVLPQYRVYFK